MQVWLAVLFSLASVAVLEVTSSPMSGRGYVQSDDPSMYREHYGAMELVNDEMRLFRSREPCRFACARSCKPIVMADSEELFFICPQVKPPEKSIPEKLLTKMSFPVILLIAVFSLAGLICVICCCKAICCDRQSHSTHSSREGLHQRHVNEITDDGTVCEKQPFPTNNDDPLPPRSMRSTRVHNV